MDSPQISVMNQLSQLDCLLISPPIHYKEEDNIWKQINSNFPPLGLISLASYLREKNHSVRIIDCNLDAPSVESFRFFFEREFFQKFSVIKFIGFTTMTCNIKKAYQVAMICKEYYPLAKIVFGGVHATFVTEEVINNSSVDVIIIGEGEITLEELIAGKNPEEISGLVFKKYGSLEDLENNSDQYEIIKTPQRERILNLDSLPLPAYDLIPILRYKPATGSYKKLPAMSLMTSRGCPGRCTFCSKTLGNLLVFRSAEKIFEEIQFLIKNYGIQQILFYDDTFTANRNNVLKLCDLIIQNKIDICWTCFARVDFVDLEMLQKMKKAGCHQIMYGVENIDPIVLQNINKKINLDQVINAVKWTKESNIECRLAFMVGNPGDTKEIIKKNIRFINQLNPDLLIVNVTTPFPGTAMFKWAKEKNLILTDDWDDYTLAKPVMKLENLSSDQIKELYKLMYRRFYFRPSFILKKLIRIRNINEVGTLFGGFKALVSFSKKRATLKR